MDNLHPIVGALVVVVLVCILLCSFFSISEGGAVVVGIVVVLEADPLWANLRVVGLTHFSHQLANTLDLIDEPIIGWSLF